MVLDIVFGGSRRLHSEMFVKLYINVTAAVFVSTKVPFLFSFLPFFFQHYSSRYGHLSYF